MPSVPFVYGRAPFDFQAYRVGVHPLRYPVRIFEDDVSPAMAAVFPAHQYIRQVDGFQVVVIAV